MSTLGFYSTIIGLWCGGINIGLWLAGTRFWVTLAVGLFMTAMGFFNLIGHWVIGGIAP
jgi:hypothetical protein